MNIALIGITGRDRRRRAIWTTPVVSAWRFQSSDADALIDAAMQSGVGRLAGNASP